MREKIVTVGLYLCMGTSLIVMMHNLDLLAAWKFTLLGERAAELALLLSMPVLLLACVRAFFRLRAAHILGLAASLLVLPWLILWERYIGHWGSSSWIMLNLPDEQEMGTLAFAEWKILATALVVLILGYCLLRLLPERWTWRGRPLCRRTWPAVALSLLLMAAWYATSVSPYRVPIIVDPLYPEYRILHVEKDGLHFRETTVGVWRNRRFAVTRTQRRLFQYRFPQATSIDVMPAEAQEAILAFGQSAELRDLRGPRPAPLRGWRDEGWYVTGPRAGPVGFRRSSGETPPKELVEVFRRIEALPVTASRTGVGKDVCLGFCYDPLAGLGIQYINQRCRSDSEGRLRCQ